MTSLIWFRNDLRIHANPALNAALERSEPVIAVYILDEGNPNWPLGSASRWWLHHSLENLRKRLAAKQVNLSFFRDNPMNRISELINTHSIDSVFWNRNYDSYSIRRDHELKQALSSKGIQVKSFNGTLLYEPWENVKSDGNPYQVFTSYWKSLLSLGIPKPYTTARFSKSNCSEKNLHGENLKDILPLPSKPNWAKNFSSFWKPGEPQALQTLRKFKQERMDKYSKQRDIPFEQATSLLSPYLHFGEISPRQIAAELMTGEQNDSGSVVRQLVWREFAYNLLYHFPHTAEQPLNAKFKDFGWRKSYQQNLQSWQTGQTGIPLVDAGMRQLWSSGWMHNRVRMVAASFLTKNLLIPWQEGAAWFWDTLVDANLPNNTMGWQWVAGCGADAAPYFRIFNPVLQGQKFDPHGDYVKTWVPELHSLPDKWIHNPWEAPTEILKQVNIKLGEDYPFPIVDLKSSRQRALDKYKKLREKN